MLIRVFVLTSCDRDTRNFYFRNGFYFCDVAAGTTTFKLMRVIISDTDYVLYSMLKVSNVSLTIILHGIYSHTLSNRQFTSDLENKIKAKMCIKTVTHCEPTSVFHNKDGISHSVSNFNNVKKVSYL